jgi:hypothetical protein
MPSPGQSTDRGVFINCPFDTEYKENLNALLFTVCHAGFSPRIATESADSGEGRFSKICELIRDCRYAIHDLSRIGIDPKTKLPRFNMVLELGLYIGAKKFASDGADKVCLVMETEQYRYRDFCSDLAGVDICAHNDDRLQLISVVRDWLDTYREDERIIPGGQYIFEDYQRFLSGLPKRCQHFHLDPQSIKYPAYLSLLEAWLKENDWRIPQADQ